jgi:hypothetical protein
MGFTALPRWAELRQYLKTIDTNSTNNSKFYFFCEVLPKSLPDSGDALKSKWY